MTKNELAVAAENFNLVTLSGDLADAVAEEMDGLGTIPFDRVKIPSGGTIAFELPSEDGGDPEVAKELVGVILYHHPVNAYWQNRFSGGNEQPDCSSFDGKTGIVRETGECRDCASCPYNQFGSSVNADGTQGNGKACKNAHRIYILQGGNPVPLILSLPPTSLKYMRDYIGKRILLKGLRSYEAITRITLKKEQSASGIDYSRAAFEFVGKLGTEQVEAAKAMADMVKASDRNVDIDESDCIQPSSGNPAPAADNDGFINVPEGSEPLPFD